MNDVQYSVFAIIISPGSDLSSAPGSQLRTTPSMSWIVKEIVDLILELPGDFYSIAPGGTWIAIISAGLFLLFSLVCCTSTHYLWDTSY